MSNPETMERLTHEAQERLHPALTNPNWLVLRERARIFSRWIDGFGQNVGRVLDVGGRIQPYRQLLGGCDYSYVAVDIAPGPFVSVTGQAENLPFASDVFDVVICTQVLEYVAHPEKAVAEMYRVLRSGGHLLLSVPAVFPRDSEPEYWRFLPSSLRMLLRDFSEVQVLPEGSTVTGLFRTLNVVLVSFSPAIVRSLVKYTIVPVLNLSGAAAEQLIGTTNDQFTANFSACARK